MIDEGDFNNTIDLDYYFDDEETTDADISFSATGSSVTIDSDHIMDISSTVVGDENITITATDENGSSVEQSFILSVRDVQHAPVIVGTIPDITIYENETFSIDLTSYESDVDDSGENLIWSLNGVSSSLLSYTIDTSEDVIEFTPLTHGTDSIFFILTDSDDLTDQQMIVFTVNEIMNGTIPGNETQGNETSGNETQGNQTSGNETQGNETSGETSSVYSNLNINEIKVYVDGDKDSGADENGGVIDDVKPGSEIRLKIEIENNGSLEIENIDVEGVIYDIDDGNDIEEEDDIGDLKAGKDEEVTLEFKIPLEVEEDDFLLELEIEGEDENDTEHRAYVNFTVRIEKEKHEIRILRAAVSSSVLECSRTADLEVKIINLGRDDEDEVTITVKNSELGINLERDEIELETDPDDDNTYATTLDLFLDDAKAGTYTIKVESYYDDDEESDSEDVLVTIKDCKSKVVEVKENPKIDAAEVVFTTTPSQFKYKKPVVHREYTFRDSSLYSIVMIIMFVMLFGMVVFLIGALIIKK